MLIAQITDTHIVERDSHWLGESATMTSERLARAVQYINELPSPPDVVVLTGDVTDMGSQAAYSHFLELVAPLKVPLYVMPGNHDQREKMRRAFRQQAYMPDHGFIQYVVDEFPVQLIVLDTLVEGESFGRLCEERIAWLQRVLEKKPAKPALIFMHHPPARTGTALFDRMICYAPPQFEEMIHLQGENILGLITGHYHHLCTTTFGGKPCFMGPSVAPVHYFAHPQDDEVAALELEDPAITLHRWEGGSTFTSHVVRLKASVQRIDWSIIKKRMQKGK